jgi:cell division protein FtsB
VDAVSAVVGSVRAAAGAQRSEVMDMPQNETRGLHMGLIDMLSKDGERGADALNAGYDAERLRMRQQQALAARLVENISNAYPSLSELAERIRQAKAPNSQSYDALVAERDALREQIDALRKSAADLKALNEQMRRPVGMTVRLAGVEVNARVTTQRDPDGIVTGYDIEVDQQGADTTNAALADVIRMHEQERQRLMLALEEAQHPETAVKPERTDGVKAAPIGITSVR